MATSSPALSWYKVPEDIKRLLLLAAENWEDTTISEQYIHQAIEKANANFDVLVTAYRYFFYKNNNVMALQIANTVIAQIQSIEQLPEDWGQLIFHLDGRKDEPNIRLFLNTYAASGLILARLGEVEKAKQISAMITEIDDKNEFGASTILSILTQPPEEEEDL